MSQITIEIEVPADLERLHLPQPLHDRLQELLDRQDRGETLTDRERVEAEALVDTSEFFSLLRLRGERLNCR